MFGDMFAGGAPSALGMYIMQSDEDKVKVQEYFYGYLNDGYSSVEAMEHALDAVGTSLENFTYSDREFLTGLIKENM